MENVWTIDYLHIFFRLFLAVLLGGAIGFEREVNNHPAGFRTHILVSVGSTLIMLISIYGFSDFIDYQNVRFDPSRIAAQVVTGIGFLGAGTILRHGFTVTGLTTAASLWVVAGIGLAIGSGFYFGAFLATFLVIISLAVLSNIDAYVTRKRQYVLMKVSVIDHPGKLGEITTLLGNKKVNVKGITITEEAEENDEVYVSITFILRVPKEESITDIVYQIKQIKGVKEIHYGKDIE